MCTSKQTKIRVEATNAPKKRFVSAILLFTGDVLITFFVPRINETCTPVCDLLTRTMVMVLGVNSGFYEAKADEEILDDSSNKHF